MFIKKFEQYQPEMQELSVWVVKTDTMIVSKEQDGGVYYKPIPVDNISTIILHSFGTKGEAENHLDYLLEHYDYYDYFEEDGQPALNPHQDGIEPTIDEWAKAFVDKTYGDLPTVREIKLVAQEKTGDEFVDIKTNN